MGQSSAGLHTPRPPAGLPPGRRRPAAAPAGGRGDLIRLGQALLQEFPLKEEHCAPGNIPSGGGAISLSLVGGVAPDLGGAETSGMAVVVKATAF